MPDIMQCAICFEKIDHVEHEYVVWQVQFQHHPKVVVHAGCAKTQRRRPIAFDYEKSK